MFEKVDTMVTIWGQVALHQRDPMVTAGHVVVTMLTISNSDWEDGYTRAVQRTRSS